MPLRTVYDGKRWSKCTRCGKPVRLSAARYMTHDEIRGKTVRTCDHEVKR